MFEALVGRGVALCTFVDSETGQRCWAVLSPSRTTLQAHAKVHSKKVSLGICKDIKKRARGEGNSVRPYVPRSLVPCEPLPGVPMVDALRCSVCYVVLGDKSMVRHRQSHAGAGETSHVRAQHFGRQLVYVSSAHPSLGDQGAPSHSLPLLDADMPPAPRESFLFSFSLCSLDFFHFSLSLSLTYSLLSPSPTFLSPPLQEMHRRAINMRYLGVIVRELVHFLPTSRTAILVLMCECVARIVKNRLQTGLQEKVNELRLPVEVPYRQVKRIYIFLLFLFLSHSVCLSYLFASLYCSLSFLTLFYLSLVSLTLTLSLFLPGRD